MTASDLEDFLSTAITDYANEKVEAGTWDEEEALAKSQDSFNKLLYDGITTPNEYLYSIISGEKIGYIWFHVDETRSGKHAFIYDFVIFEAFRGKGFGTKTLEALDALAKEMQIT
ncbi:TPA_asm: GNAT family N-acetyltransferase, partial [Listeria monocytogenes]|nr:GNAT family N-acetyltransferase [Listeria monocytogenes]